MKIFRGIAIIVLLLSFSLPAAIASAAPLVRTAAISLNSFRPTPVLIGSELTFNLNISVANIDPGVAGADVYLSYNPAFVSPPTTPGAPAVEALPDFFGVSNISINEVLPAAKCPVTTNPCIHLVVAGPAQVTQTGVAVRFHFNGIAEGTACFAVINSTLVDADGYQVVHTVGQPTCMDVKPRTITGTILRQGVPANPNVGGGTLACSRVTANGPVTVSVYTDTNGKFKFSNLPAGTYTFNANYSGYLASQKTGVAVDQSTLIDLGTTELSGGDVNIDTAINILDIGKIVSMFGQSGMAVGSDDSANCAVATDEPSDINDDGNINISDLAITAGNWGKTGPTAWALR